MFDWRRISSRWYAVIVLVAAVPGVIGTGVYLAFGGHPAPLVAPAAIAALLVVNLVTASAEELGWRGYALEPLQARLSALHASLILGVVWALWHLPLYFINGTYQAENGLGSLAS